MSSAAVVAISLDIVSAACLIYLVMAVDRLAESIGRTGDRLRDLESTIHVIKRAMKIPYEGD